MTLSDNNTNTEILYLYIKKFKWLNPINHEGFGGHPKEGRVYRVIKNTDTNSYRLIYGRVGTIGQGIMFQTLYSDNDDNGYTAEMIPITKSNILDFNIEEEDLDLLSVWVGTNNQDIKQLFEPSLIWLRSSPPTPPSPPPSTPPTPPSAEKVELGEFVECASELQAVDPISFDTIHELIHTMIKPYEESIEVLNLRMSRGFGGGANMVKVFEHLSRYIGDDRRTNKDPNDLFNAQKYIIYEINRLKLA